MHPNVASICHRCPDKEDCSDPIPRLQDILQVSLKVQVATVSYHAINTETALPVCTLGKCNNPPLKLEGI
jgi:hypothetical protein